MTFVALSRVKHIKDLVVESFGFDRLSNIKNSKQFKKRQLEMDRLKKLAAETSVWLDTLFVDENGN